MRNIFAGLMLALVTMPLLGGPAEAAPTTDQMLVVTPYKAGQALDFFYAHSVHPLKFIEDPAETPEAISIITSAQKAEYEQAGYKPDVVDTSVGKLEQYSLLFKRDQKDTTPINIVMSDTLRKQGVELVSPVGKKRLLVKFAVGSSLGQVAKKNAQFAQLQGPVFHADAVAPLGRTAVAQKTVNPAPTDSNDPRWQREIIIVLVGLLLIVLIQSAYRMQHKKK